MGWLIVRIEPKENATVTEAHMAPPVETFRRRHRLGEPRFETVQWLIGPQFEVQLPIGKQAPNWPYTAYVYTSKRKDGYGRSGSSLYRWPCRRNTVS